MHPPVSICACILNHKLLGFLCLANQHQVIEVAALDLLKHGLRVSVINEFHSRLELLADVHALYNIFSAVFADFHDKTVLRSENKQLQLSTADLEATHFAT